MARLPQVFLSSTFFDLQQVRADIAAFVDRDLGYRFLASEHRSFPVDPAANTIENCRRRVQDDADIFVLIIGGRFGSLAPGRNTSITNLEYQTAKAKAIPIFVFVHRDILALLPIAERNPSADFSSAVDSPQIFDFVREVRTTDRVWVFPFELAQDIVNTLRTQLAYEVSRCFNFALSARRSPFDRLNLKGRAFQLSVEQPDGWQAKLFAQVLIDGVDELGAMRQAHRLQLVGDAGDVVSEEDAAKYISAAIRQGERVARGMKGIVNAVVNEAFAKGDIDAIVNGARAMTDVFRNVLTWSARLRNAHVPADWQPLASAASRILDDFIREAEEFGPRAQAEIEAALQGDTGRLSLVFEYDVSESPELVAALHELQRKRS